MSSMTLYVKRDSIIHNLDPLTKILFIFVSIAMTYIYPNLTFVIIVTTVSLLLLVTGRVFMKILPIIGISLVLILSIIVIQGLVHPSNETVLFKIGIATFYKEGLLNATLVATRVVNMISAFGVLILTTRPDELVERLIQKGLSPKIGYVFLSIFQLLPEMQSTMGKITDAQRSRGMETEGNLFVRMKAFFPLIGPVVLNSLNDTKERAIAIEMRGFSTKGKRTFIKEPKSYKYSTIINLLLITLLIATILGRILL